MIKSIEPNPDGTILGDLNLKLSRDIEAALDRYTDLAHTMDIPNGQIMGSIFSTLIMHMLVIESATSRSGVIEEFAQALRPHYQRLGE